MTAKILAFITWLVINLGSVAVLIDIARVIATSHNAFYVLCSQVLGAVISIALLMYNVTSFQLLCSRYDFGDND